MAGRKVRCEECGKKMGIIKDANLRIGLVILCMVCNKTRKTEKVELANLKTMIKKMKTEGFPDFLGDIFKGFPK